MKRLDLRAFKNDFGAPAEVQQISRIEIDKQQTGPGIEQQVAQGVEKQVAGEIRNGQAIAFYLYETGLAAAVRNVHRTLAIDVHVTGDEEGIGSGDHGFGRVIQPVEVLRDAGRTDPPTAPSETGAIGCIAGNCRRTAPPSHRSRSAVIAPTRPLMRLRRRVCSSIPSRPIAAPSRQLRRIISARQAAKLQRARLGRVSETRLALQEYWPRDYRRHPPRRTA